MDTWPHGRSATQTTRFDEYNPADRVSGLKKCERRERERERERKREGKERERDRQTETEKERERQRQRETEIERDKCRRLNLM